MKILIKDSYIGISGVSEIEKKIIEKSFTFRDSSQAMTRTGYDKNKVRNVKMFSVKADSVILRTGFFQDFLRLSKENNFKIEEVKDDREKFWFQKKQFTDEEVSSYFDPKYKYIEHQVRAVKSMLKTSCGVLKLPTSAGKTTVLEVFLKIVDIPTLILIDGVSLSTQTRRDLNNAGLDVGICNGKGKTLGKHMISTIGSVKKLNLTSFQCLIIDECHTSASKTYQEFLSKTSYPLRFGLSATPEGNDNYRWATIRQFLGNIISETKSRELLDNDVITPPEIHFKKINCIPTMDWPSAYETNITKNYNRNLVAAELANDFDDSVLILFKIIEHGQELQKLIPDSVLLSGEHSLKEREEVSNKFRNGEIKVLIASNIFKQGISINNIKMLINVSGGKSKIEVLQKLGRGLRKCEGKKKALVYDFLDDGNDFTYKHSLQRMQLYKKAGFDDIQIDK